MIYFSPIRRLYRYAKPYRVRMILATICTVLHNIFDILPETFIGIAVDVVINRHNSFLAQLGINDISTQLSVLGGLTFVIWVLEALFEYLSEIIWRSLAQTIQHELRLDAYEHMQSLEMSYFEEKNSGELVAILNDDINQLEHFFDKGIIDGIYFIVTIIIVIFIFCYLAPIIALYAFIPIPAIVLLAYTFQARLGPLYVAVREHAGMVGARIANNIMGIATIKSYTTEEYELNKLKNDSYAYKHANSAAIKVSAAFIPVIRIAIAFGFVITIVLGGWYVVQEKLAVGAYSVLVAMTQRLLWPFIYMAKITDVYKRTMACTQRVFMLLDLPIAATDGTQQKEKGQIKGSITFQDIAFSYPNGISVFDNISLHIKQGQTVGIVGATGSGKSTLVKLLLRFYEPSQGSILLDDISINSLQLQFFRQSFGLVSQDVFLFKGTLQENIMYGSPQATQQEIEHAAHIAQIHDFIISLPHGYQTMIGQMGQKLSGGQKQRIAIARAIVNNPPVFIFDEATSSVDNETERLIQQALAEIARNHTICIIAHRLATIRNADIIFVFNKGTIVENGNHEQLLANGGTYARLWGAQMGDMM